jgi:thiamine-phosphate pyrophosphorylase
MPESTLLYYITDRKAFPGDESTRRRRLLDKIAEAATHGVNYIQLREKDLSARGLESLAREAMRIIRDQGLRTENGELKAALLVNSRTDVALAVSADGVHLRSDDVSPAEVGAAWKRGADTPDRKNLLRDPIIAISCHSPQEAAQAAAKGASFAVFAPVFEKTNAPGTLPTGLEALRQACRARIPVLALGGVTLQNAGSCLNAGAAGIAAIRLFQENEIAVIVRELREP